MTKKNQIIPGSVTTSSEPKPIPAAVAAEVKKLSIQDIDEIVAIVANAPCPGGIPQADMRRALLQRFVASQELTDTSQK